MFGILVKSNAALWTNNDAVHATWSRRAHELCGGDYVELASQELDETLKPINSEVLRDHVTSRLAFALCASSKLSQQEALDVINRSACSRHQRARQLSDVAMRLRHS